MNLNRRSLLKLSAATMAAGTIGLPSFAQQIDELVIAYNVNLPSWDPTVGPSAVNPTIQGIYQSVFDQYILQQPDLSPAPGLLTVSHGMTDRPSPLKTWHGTLPAWRTRKPAARSSSSGAR